MKERRHQLIAALQIFTLAQQRRNKVMLGRPLGATSTHGAMGNNNPSDHDERKISVYLDPETLTQIRTQAFRLDRSISWIAQTAWRIAREQLQSVPSFREPKR